MRKPEERRILPRGSTLDLFDAHLYRLIKRQGKKKRINWPCSYYSCAYMYREQVFSYGIQYSVSAHVLATTISTGVD